MKKYLFILIALMSLASSAHGQAWSDCVRGQSALGVGNLLAQVVADHWIAREALIPTQCDLTANSSGVVIASRQFESNFEPQVLYSLNLHSSAGW